MDRLHGEGVSAGLTLHPQGLPAAAVEVHQTGRLGALQRFGVLSVDPDVLDRRHDGADRLAEQLEGLVDVLALVGRGQERQRADVARLDLQHLVRDGPALLDVALAHEDDALEHPELLLA